MHPYEKMNQTNKALSIVVVLAIVVALCMSALLSAYTVNDHIDHNEAQKALTATATFEDWLTCETYMELTEEVTCQ